MRKLPCSWDVQPHQKGVFSLLVGTFMWGEDIGALLRLLKLVIIRTYIFLNCAVKPNIPSLHLYAMHIYTSFLWPHFLIVSSCVLLSCDGPTGKSTLSVIRRKPPTHLSAFPTSDANHLLCLKKQVLTCLQTRPAQ